MRPPAFPPARLSDLRTVDLDELAHRARLVDEPDDLVLDPGPMLDALIAGAWLGVRLGVALVGAVIAAGVAVDRTRHRR